MFNKSLAGGRDLLADEREELAAALNNLETALADVTYVRQAEPALAEETSRAQPVTTCWSTSASAEEILDVAPLALNNLGLRTTRSRARSTPAPT